MFIRSFELEETFRNIEPFSINFRESLNIIVGENGSGKSTLLTLLSSKKPCKCKIDFEKGIQFKFFDTEKMNPRIKSNISGGFDVASRFMSHGQAIIALVKAIEDFENIVVFLDEPEAGVSLSNQKRLLESFTKAIKNNCQLILTTHSYVLIQSVDEVFNLDSKTWVSSKIYLERVLR
jgi:predicted ATPase